MLLQSLRAPYLAPGGPESIWNYLGAPVRSSGVSGRFACGFWTDLHFADEVVDKPYGVDISPFPYSHLAVNP